MYCKALILLDLEKAARVNLGKENVDVDSVFDFEPLDWLKGLYESGQIAKELNDSIVALYNEIDEYTENMSFLEEDRLIASNEQPMSDWRRSAAKLLSEIKKRKSLISVSLK